jgi:hypothetical protein
MAKGSQFLFVYTGKRTFQFYASDIEVFNHYRVNERFVCRVSFKKSPDGLNVPYIGFTVSSFKEVRALSQWLDESRGSGTDDYFLTIKTT